MPTEQGGYFSRLQSEMDTVKNNQQALSVAISRRDELTRQLHGEPALSTTGAPAAPGTPGASAGRAATLCRAPARPRRTSTNCC